MILSVSRRTDVPAFYSDWFFNRLKEGFLYVRNPMNPHQISRIELSFQVVDCIVFWTKNPVPMMGRLEELGAYPYYFQFTITGYGKDVEANLPDKRGVVLPAFQELSRRIGRDRVVWRYDPVFISPRYTLEYHVKAFREISGALAGYTDRVAISFGDFYAKTLRNTRGLCLQEMTEDEMTGLAERFAEIAIGNSMKIESCAEAIDLQDVGIRHGCCIDKELIERITGKSLAGVKDKNQRQECGCLESVEVGAYHTCLNGCKYCYANDSYEKARANAGLYDADSPLLCGRVGEGDKVTIRKMKSLVSCAH